MTEVKNLYKEIAAVISTYTNEITEGLEATKLETAKNVVKILKDSSPKDTGGYAKGWRISKVGTAQVIHNKTKYQLTHLLEHGHVKVGGGRVGGKVHIRPAEEKAIEDFISGVEKVIKG